MKKGIIILVTAILTLLVFLASCASKKGHCDAYGNKSAIVWNENVTSV